VDGLDSLRTGGVVADPTRRAMLARLAHGEATVNEPAEPHAMKRRTPRRKHEGDPSRLPICPLWSSGTGSGPRKGSPSRSTLRCGEDEADWEGTDHETRREEP